MHLTTSANLFLFLVIFCVGAAVGGMVERALKRRAAALPPEPLPVPPPVAQPPSHINPLAEADDREILSAWRTRSNKVWLGMDGTRLNDRAALQPEQFQRLFNLVIDLRPWLETARPAAPTPVATQQPLRAATPAPTMPQKTALGGKKNGAPAEEAVPPAPVFESIIQQIDKVLQTKLETSPFKDRGIQLIEGPGGIVIVKDGVNKYEGVDGIPDPDVKALIRQAVADWEKGPSSLAIK